ncbi:cytochrome c oxidase assembly factor 1 homolog isoform 1-T5 [Anomaloglossus baeobatrachus]|uniref:cytochrome c oxidase assembly factor 1 homolog n=1 Tax=Anomaloglossus baeobatrachus TaxID=238106 RepID=UPI003F501984
MPVPLKNLQQLAIYATIVSGGGCAMMYYLIQKSFSQKEYYLDALQKLQSHSSVLERLGAPPLKVHNLRLTDRYNHVDKTTAQIKIPVSGTTMAGYLYSTAVKEQFSRRWNLQDVVLKLNNGESVPIYHSDVCIDEGEDLSSQVS